MKKNLSLFIESTLDKDRLLPYIYIKKKVIHVHELAILTPLPVRAPTLINL